MLFHPANVPLKVFSILFKVHWACCVEYSDVPNTRAGSIKLAGSYKSKQGGKMEIFSIEMVASREEFLEI